MTAATALEPADAIVAAAARAVYDRARHIADGQPGHIRKPVEDATWALSDALEFYRLIHAGIIHPLSAYQELRYRCREDQRYAEALRMAAADAAEEAAELIKVIAEHIGEDAAAMVRGENNNGGTQS